MKKGPAQSGLDLDPCLGFNLSSADLDPTPTEQLPFPDWVLPRTRNFGTDFNPTRFQQSKLINHLALI